MEEKPLLEQWRERYASDADYLAEVMALDFVERVAQVMEFRGLTRSALAEKMHVSPAYISRTLNAPPNLTLRTIAAFGIAFGVRPSIRFPTGVEAITVAPAAGQGSGAAAHPRTILAYTEEPAWKSALTTADIWLASSDQPPPEWTRAPATLFSPTTSTAPSTEQSLAS
jgi:transcriptional regulator with XRE-family HTH domain